MRNTRLNEKDQRISIHHSTVKTTPQIRATEKMEEKIERRAATDFKEMPQCNRITAQLLNTDPDT